MKIVYKPLSEFQKTKSGNQSVSNNSFQDMLSRHLKQVRHPSQGGNPNIITPKNQNLAIKPSNTNEQQDVHSAEGLETLKDLDSEYYKKGINKKTLAETFSARNKSNLDNRIKKYQHLIQSKAKKYKLDPNLLAGLIRQESNFNPYAVSHCGAMGLGQLMPETARYLGVKDPFNASQNLDAAAKYLREQLDTFGGNESKALAAYNAGPGAVKKYGGIPPYRETQNYVSAIRSHRAQISRLDLFGKKSV